MNQQTGATVAIHCGIVDKINFACHQSAFAILRDLALENKDPHQPLEDLRITLTADPAFLEPKTWQVDRLPAATKLHVNDRDVRLKGDFLRNLPEAVRGTVTLTVERQGDVLARLDRPVELLAPNEWGGTDHMPELLAAFCLPNDPAVDRILHEASRLLRVAGKPDGIDGYRSGSRRRVWEIAAAIYSAIAGLDIRYAVPPASFERDGQKIRLPGQILEGRVATCLDTTLLFAAALEQAGLNPIVVLPEGHALVGLWLQPEELSSVLVDDAETLRKRIQLDELILIETTYVTQHPTPPFSRAVKAGAEAIDPERDDTFDAAADIRRARALQIAPLALTGGDAGAEQEIQAEAPPLEEAPPLPDFDETPEDAPPETPGGRLERWQRKLLDLSARNPLLNHRASRSSLRILCPDPARLEDRLAEGAKIAIAPLPKRVIERQDEVLHRQRTGRSIVEEYARDALDKKQVLVDMPKEELERRTVTLYRKTQTALQEGGANTLYLALGFLLWKRNENDDRRFRAPLILLPVSLERRSVRSGVRLVAHDDEPRFNTTLLEMLRKDFALDIRGLDGPLPQDHSGIDVTGIWNRVRKAVKDAPGFEVVEEVVLGHFSFAKYLMWKDLVERTEALRRNRVVRHLMDTPRDPFPSEVDFVADQALDREYRPSDLLTPLPADASQMAAIASADRGKDFVLIGPPGTGKSQTISNLIAHLLGKGKTVLFVSEKTAALEVVHRRLEAVGLGDFCLPLHSNKARKADVLEQLRRAWERAETRNYDTTAWQTEAERLRQLRDRLNRLVDHLHTPGRNGLTPHYAMGVKIRDADLAERVRFHWPRADQHDSERLQRMREAAERLRIQGQAVGEVTDTPFRLVEKGDWSPHWETQMTERAERLAATAASAEAAAEALLEALGIDLPDHTLARLEGLAELAATLLEAHGRPLAFALGPDGTARLEALEQGIAHLRAHAQARNELCCPYEPGAWCHLDGEQIARRWRQASESWWPKRYFARRRIIREMRAGGALGTPDPERDAPLLARLRAEEAAIERLDAHLAPVTPWAGPDTDPEALETLKGLALRLREASGRLADDPAALARIRQRLHTLLGEADELLAPSATVGRAARRFLDDLEDFRAACAAFEEQAGGSPREAFAASHHAFAAIREAAGQIARRHAELRAWCGWRRRRAEALALDLRPLVEAIEAGRVPADEVERTFEAAYCAWWSAALIDEDEVLRTFSSPEHEALIHDFRELDERYQRLTAETIAATLCARFPRPGDVARTSDWGVLRHELQKKKRHKPVRRLLEEIPEALTRLTPCLMMSPLSVAQYLPADRDVFDVVIFDEASQITTWDAIGSLARGRQVVVAGDPKQMPPTNFFARADDDPDGDIDVEGDLESILDEMLGAGIPQKTLNLHYRSRRESLIAFSNARYYDSRLVTFPAPVFPDQGVRLIPVKGHYERGKARHNLAEARAIVAEILARLTHPDEEQRGRSIGVVTFNAEQQTLIENLLDEARAAHPEIEWAFSPEAVTEPVFVKNLETVQGDERDVILFSVTYGPDRSGRVTMNFGPLNREGGERRLNVALTRARHEMRVFSTLRPDQIDLNRTRARAVIDLKHFLEYAERGPAALGEAVYGPQGDFESPFEAAVARALRERGWDVHPQIGVSAYRIDLGVVHPDRPGAYLAGIECDGASYHSSAYARERDKIRQQVLEGLGWTLLRVWSLDWWSDPVATVKKLDEALRERLARDRAQRPEGAGNTASDTQEGLARAQTTETTEA